MAKEKGGRFGRPSEVDVEKFKAMDMAGIPMTQITDKLGISPQYGYKLRKKLLADKHL